MDRVSLDCLNAFLKGKSEADKSHLLNYLPERAREYVLSLGEAAVDPKSCFFPPHSLLTQVDPSWFLPHLSTFSENDKNILISVLSSDQQKRLSSELTINEKTFHPSKLGVQFIADRLTHFLMMDGPPIKPVVCLRHHPLIFLLDLKRDQIEKAIFFLGLHDLAPELKRTVETRLLKSVDEILEEDEKVYLKSLMEKRSLIQFTPLKLTGWDRQKSSFDEVIRARGLNRLAKALFGSDESFFWHLMHKLEKSYAYTLKKLAVDPKNPKAQSALQEEVINVAKFILEGSS